jgi:GTPase SAR1 family protein
MAGMATVNLTANWLLNVFGFNSDFLLSLQTAICALAFALVGITLVSLSLMPCMTRKASKQHLKVHQKILTPVKKLGELFHQRREKEISMQLQGFEGSGKATVLQSLKRYAPGINFSVQAIRNEKTSLELGKEFDEEMYRMLTSAGRCSLRPLERQKYLATNAFIFVVDSTDHLRIGQVRKDLWELVFILGNENLLDALLLVFANKQDLPNAMSITDVTDKLDLNSIKNWKWFIQSCSATTGTGIHEGLHWAMTMLGAKDEGFGSARFFQTKFWMNQGLALL